MEKALLLSAKSGDQFAFSELLRKYSPLIDSMSERFGKLSDGDGSDPERDDMRQEACIGFYRALLTYDTEQDKVSFGLYAKICIRNRLVSILRKKKSENKRIRKSSLPVEATAASQEYGVDKSEIASLVDKVLSGYEKKVFLLYLDGVSYSDISARVGRSEKSVDNALFRAKKKLKGLLGT